MRMSNYGGGCSASAFGVLGSGFTVQGFAGPSTVRIGFEAMG